VIDDATDVIVVVSIFEGLMFPALMLTATTILGRFAKSTPIPTCTVVLVGTNGVAPLISTIRRYALAIHEAALHVDGHRLW
jgi:hypothetical protein